MFAKKWPGKKPLSKVRVSNMPLKAIMDDLKDTTIRLFKAISELMIRMAVQKVRARAIQVEEIERKHLEDKSVRI